MGNGSSKNIVDLLLDINPERRGEVFKRILIEHKNGLNHNGNGVIKRKPALLALMPNNNRYNENVRQTKIVYLPFDPSKSYKKGTHIKFNMPMRNSNYCAQGKIVGFSNLGFVVGNVYVPEKYDRLPKTAILDCQRT